MKQEELFKHPLKEKISSNQPAKKAININENLECLPLFYALQKNLIKHNFDLICTSFCDSSRILRDGIVELSVIPSIEYARKKETWQIVPGICISSFSMLQNAELFFKKGLKEIKSIAVDTNACTSLILLKILMREKYHIEPEYKKMQADLDIMLNKTDAALLVGNNVYSYYHENRNRMNLTEEWVDFTGLPFVHSFWAGRDFTVSSFDVKDIKLSFKIGMQNLETIAKEFAGNKKESWVFYHDILSKNINYKFSEKAKDGLLEFYNYAFYFGFTEFIPELHFY